MCIYESWSWEEKYKPTLTEKSHNYYWQETKTELGKVTPVNDGQEEQTFEKVSGRMNKRISLDSRNVWFTGSLGDPCTALQRQWFTREANPGSSHRNGNYRVGGMQTIELKV